MTPYKSKKRLIVVVDRNNESHSFSEETDYEEHWYSIENKMTEKEYDVDCVNITTRLYKKKDGKFICDEEVTKIFIKPISITIYYDYSKELK